MSHPLKSGVSTDMGRSGYLPDLSGVFNSWRDMYKKSMSSGDWVDASLALHNMNGALDVDYRLPISSVDWDKNADSYLVWKCRTCTSTETKTINKGEDDEYTKEVEVPTTSRFEDVKLFDVICNLELSLMSGQKSLRMWICPKCKTEDTVRSVEAEQLAYPSPHYRGCIYDEPIRPNLTIATRRGSYPNQMEAWCRNYSIELEHQLAIYRLEYIKQNGVDMEDSGYKDDGK